jgi:parallel beta-helix repeat protein
LTRTLLSSKLRLLHEGYAISISTKKLSLTLILAIVLLLSEAATQVATAQPLLISITTDGDIEGTSAIQRNGNVYTLTSNLKEASIVIDASNIVLDGTGFTLQGEIYEMNGDDVEIKNLKIISSGTAIQIFGSGCKIKNNEIQAEGKGIRIRESNNNVISGNTITAEIEAGIAFESSSYNEVTENTVSSSVMQGGVDLSNSDFNTFSSNTIYFVSLYKSSHNIFDENNLPQGISLRNKSNYNEITGNTITDFNELTEPNFLSSGSIEIERCESNVISSNTLSNSGGIFLDTSSNNVLRNNSVESAGLCFEVSGAPQPSLSSFINDIDDSNTINGKNIYYLINETDVSINPSTYSNIGYLALVNCKRMTVENTHFNTQGILLAWTTNSQITNNDISNNYGDGVLLNYASNNQITRNNINANSGAGIRLSYSNQNNVSGNYITRNQMGIYLILSADNNTIVENNIADQDTGISFHTSSNNLIYHNNIVNNTKQVYDVGWEGIGQPFPGTPLPSENIWDNDYPTGGNYWSNYVNEYPEAKELDGSGIWETPYIIDENNQDRYPLMNPVSIPTVQVPEAPDGETPITPTEEPFPTILVLALTASVLIAGAGLLLYFKTRKH